MLIGCGTTEKTQQESGPEASDDTIDETVEKSGVSEAFLVTLNTNRSMLSDAYSGLNNDIPAFFLQQSEARDIGDPNEGYRIQILSTRNVASADSLANDFRKWAEEVFDDYVPKAYVLFRQPYYKVHIGNFQFYNRAMELNQFLKSRYPDAWVVHDKVEPNLVPPETVNLKKE